MSVENVLQIIKDEDVKFLDFRFTDTRGKEQHVSYPAHSIDEDTFSEGVMFDGSSVAGWKGINESDMILMPDASTAVLDPFMDDTTLIVRCDIVEPATMQGYERDPRSVAKRAEAYLASTGLADTAFLVLNQNFSSLMTFAGAVISLVHSIKSTLTNLPGILKKSSLTVTRVTVQV